jgi:hypothetical protein
VGVQGSDVEVLLIRVGAAQDRDLDFLSIRSLEDSLLVGLRQLRQNFVVVGAFCSVQLGDFVGEVVLEGADELGDLLVVLLILLSLVRFDHRFNPY